MAVKQSITIQTDSTMQARSTAIALEALQNHIEPEGIVKFVELLPSLLGNPFVKNYLQSHKIKIKQ